MGPPAGFLITVLAFLDVEIKKHRIENLTRRIGFAESEIQNIEARIEQMNNALEIDRSELTNIQVTLGVMLSSVVSDSNWGQGKIDPGG